MEIKSFFIFYPLETKTLLNERLELLSLFLQIHVITLLIGILFLHEFLVVGCKTNFGFI